MYPRNAASPERIAIGAVVLIADGTVQTSGVSIKVLPQGGTASAGGGTISYEEGIVHYLPTQAETNYTSLIIIAYKTSCIPASTTIVTTASATSGTVLLAPVTHTSAVIPTVSTLTGHTAQTGDAFARLGAPAGASISADVAAVKTDTGNLVTRITSTLFSGITSMAQWLGLLAGKQVGNSTARTEIRATGAGAGTFDETTDSQEAIRDNMGTAQTGDAFARLGAPAGASVSADVAAIKTQTAAIEVDTQDIQARLPAALVSGRIDASVGAMATGVLTATAIAADAITDAKVASDVTIASVTGSVGSVTGSVGSVTGNVGGNVVGTIGGLTAAALADFFDTNSGTTYASAVAGSVVKEIADNAGGSSLTAGAIADAVWDEVLSGHLTSGTTGAALNASGSAGDPWSTVLPGAYGAGTAGKIIGDNINATISSRLASASYTAPLDAAGTRSALGMASANLDTQLTAIDDYLDTEVAAIKAKTDNLPTDPADASDIAASFSTVNSTLSTIAGYIDTEVAAIKADTAAILLDTGTDGVVVADKTGFRLSSTGVNDIVRTALTEGYAADGATFTLEQGLYMIWALLAERGLSGTTLTAKKLDGSTTAMTFTLDDGTTPTSQTRAT